VAEAGARAPVEVWSDLVTSLVGMDLVDALALVKVPALVLASDLDRLTPPVSARAVANGLPDARLVEIAGAGHCAMLERPEEFNDAVDRFLRDVLGRRPRPAQAGSGGPGRRRGTKR